MGSLAYKIFSYSEQNKILRVGLCKGFHDKCISFVVLNASISSTEILMVTNVTFDSDNIGH
jgi:hypothetical protein